MNVALLPPKSAESSRDVESGHATTSNTPDAKAVAVLLEVAENEEQKRRTTRKIWKIVLALTCAAMGVNLLLFPVFKSRWQNMSGPLFYAIITIINLILPNGSCKTKRLQNAVASLLQLPREPRNLLPLVDALHVTQTPEGKARLFPALTECLWNLPAADAALSLDDTRRAALRNTLSHVYAVMPNGKRQVRTPGTFDDVTADFAVAIMKTLAGMGDTKTEKVLQKIVKAEATTPNESVVRDAAREYLPALVQRIAEDNEMQRQLRQRAGDQIRDPQQMVEEFLDTLSPETANIVMVECLRAEQKGKLACAIGAVAQGILACLLPYLGFHDLLALFVVIIFFLSPSVCALLVVANSKWSNAARLIAGELARRSEDDARLLAVLLHAAQYTKNTKQADTLKKAFARLLPRLQPSDAALVPPAQRAYLRSWLKLPRNSKKAGSGSQTLTIVALNALAALGDTKALRAAEQIARQTRNGSYRETELHEAAVRCVEALRTRQGPG